MRWQLPFSPPGQVVGLLGGSFDPPHAGHVHITRAALQRFDLDRVWWLVSPGNPLKARGPAALPARMVAARRIMTDPRVTVTDIEAQLGTRYTAQTLAALTRLYPRTRFVWLMGADNLAQFHRWQDWRRIMQTVPVGVLARPGERMAARTGKAAKVFRAHKLPPRAAPMLARVPLPAWCFVNLPLNAASSSAIRASGAWINPALDRAAPDET